MKIAILHRYPEQDIKATNASFPYFVDELRQKGHTVDVKTFKSFNRFRFKLIKSLFWVVYSPFLVIGRNYAVIYCDDSFPFYAWFVKLASPKSKVIKRMGDLHLMYYCSGWIYKFFHWFERWEWRWVDTLIPIMPLMQDYIGLDLRGVRPYQLYTVYDPIDVDFFKPEVPEPMPLYDVMFHGFLNENKGLGMLLEAAKRLPNVKFCIIGGGPSMEKLVLKATPNIDFKGALPFEDMPYWLNRTKIGLCLRAPNPGNDYVITQALLQYAAVGKPLITSYRKCLGDEPMVKTVDDLVEHIYALLYPCAWVGEGPEKRRERQGRMNRWLMENQNDARLIAKQLVEVVNGC